MQKDCDGIDEIVANDGTIIIPEICDHSSSPESLMYKFKWNGDQYYYDIYHAIFDIDLEIVGFFVEQDDKNFKMYLFDLGTDKRTCQEVFCDIENMICAKDEKTKTFILKAQLVHGRRYNYSLVTYTTSSTNVTIICNEHGRYYMRPNNHLNGQGCKLCGFKYYTRARTRNSMLKLRQVFIRKAKELYGNKYNYDEIIRFSDKECVKILCTIPSHGFFFQYPRDHLETADFGGCPKCAKTIVTSTEESKIIDRMIAPDGTIINPDINSYLISESYDHSSFLHSLIHRFEYGGNNYYYDIYHMIFNADMNSVGYFVEQDNKNFKMYLFNIKKDSRKYREVISDIENMINLKDVNTRAFIKKAQQKHGYKYNYSKTIYINRNTNVAIICDEHNVFYQNPMDHLNSKYGCGLCSNKARGITRRKSQENFIRDAKKKYGDRFNYDEVNYVTATIPIKIFCTVPSHGYFFSTPNNLLHPKTLVGCRKCSVLISGNYYTQEKFINKSNEIFNGQYDYSLVEYKMWNIPVNIICKVHGSYHIKPTYHLRGVGCSKCSHQKMYSKVQIEWLNFLARSFDIKIEHATNVGEHRIKASKYRADGYCEENNTIFEFHGCYFHGCIKCFENRNDINEKLHYTFAELYNKTENKKKHIENQGYTYIQMWGCDWMKIIKSDYLMEKYLDTMKLKLKKNVVDIDIADGDIADGDIDIADDDIDIADGNIDNIDNVIIE